VAKKTEPSNTQGVAISSRPVSGDGHVVHGPGHRMEIVPIAATSKRGFGWLWLVCLATLVVLLPGLTLGILNHYDSAEVAWVDALYSRKEVIASRKAAGDHARLVIIGGSGALFGVDGELIEKKLGWPTINFASHGGLGTEYLLDRPKRILRRGDVALLCMEYGLWPQPGGAINQVAWPYFITYDKSYFRQLGPKQSLRALYSVPLGEYWDSFHGWLTWARDREHQLKDIATYYTANMSLNGDIRAFWPAKHAFTATSGYIYPSRQFGSSTYLIEFSHWAREHGVRVLWTWANVMRPETPRGLAMDQPPPESIQFLQSLGFEIIGTPAEASYPRECYFDTEYHTQPYCRRVRTEHLIRLLRPSLGLAPVAADLQKGLYIIAQGNHQLTDGNLFADRPAVGVKYLVNHPPDHPDAITPQQVVDLSRQGIPIYFDEPAVADMLQQAGLQSHEIAHETVSLNQWLGRYNHHLILMVRGDGKPVTGPVDALPTKVQSALAANGPLTAAVGTGPYTDVLKLDQNPKQATLRKKLSQLISDSGPAMMIDLTSSADKTTARISYRDLYNHKPGLFALAIDPQEGVVSAIANFDPAGMAVLWSMRQAIPSP
jgi:hypothetical protein